MITSSAAALATAVALIAHHAPAHIRAGAPVGTVDIPAIGVVQTLTQGGPDLYTLAFPPELNNGPAVYPRHKLPHGKYVRGALPWQQGVVAIAGHRTTWTRPFHDLNQLRKGNAVIIRTQYATFWYRVYSMKIVSPNAYWYLTGKRGYRLVLSACHPPRKAIHRIVVFAKLVAVRSPYLQTGRAQVLLVVKKGKR